MGTTRCARTIRTTRGRVAAGLAAGVVAALAGTAPSAAVAAPPTDRGGPPPVGHELPKVAVMTGSGGAVASVDAVASQVGIDVLEAGGNATDAAIATAAALGVTEPYSTGIGGGGFFVHRDASTGVVETIDGRETAPATYDEASFIDEATGQPLPFATAVSSGCRGASRVPANVERPRSARHERLVHACSSRAERIALHGFVVDQTFRDQTASNAACFEVSPRDGPRVPPGGAPPVVGSVFRNPDMAQAYRELRTRGVDSLYEGRLGEAIVAEVTDPSTRPDVDVHEGEMTPEDLRAYRALVKAPIHSEYRGMDVYGMPVPSSGGIAVGEILNLIEAYDERTGTPTSEVDDVQYLHRFSEASATAFADRNRYVGDVPGVPTGELRQAFADERACLFDPTTTIGRPVPFGAPDGSYVQCGPATTAAQPLHEDVSTTHLSVVDRWGDAVAYTSTIEATGGSGITVPGWGFLLNNELTDFNFAPPSSGVPDPNLPGPGKRPRSSMSPTMVVDDGTLELVAGSPGGASIITTVAQIVLGHYERGLTVGDALAAPRLSSRNGASEQAEPAIASGPVGAGLAALGHSLVTTAEIGAATAVQVLGTDLYVAAAEPSRRGGGSAMVVDPED